MSYVRWSERKAEVEAWVAAAWAAAKRRWTARWMPIVAAVGILAVLVLVGALNGVAALIGDPRPHAGHGNAGHSTRPPSSMRSREMRLPHVRVSTMRSGQAGAP